MIRVSHPLAHHALVCRLQSKTRELMVGFRRTLASLDCSSLVPQ